MKTCGKPYHDTLGIVVNCSEETPCRDCLLVEVGRLGYLVQSLQGEQVARSAPVAVEVLNPPKRDKDCGDCVQLAHCNGALACACGPSGKMFIRKDVSPRPTRILNEGEVVASKDDLALLLQDACRYSGGADDAWDPDEVVRRLQVVRERNALRSGEAEGRMG